ncbi:MBL fold metallo-hydrolase [uncultured Cellulomonas sp.]|uniref:MBL fold metallo-hydrolase n=1 Tax=uncultured Cellulomonas sp. TaxID=189682 RepID=UPI0028EF5B6C|nr:MBL fold metallo-hydrolase [uncultured Cellulomonas sp.]
MARSQLAEVALGVFRVRDTCHVYVVVAPGSRSGIAVDFGSGLVLDLLDEIGIDRITDVLMTHHHRDQGQGLPRAVGAGVRVHVPPVERDLFDGVADMWRTRPLDNDYNVRQDRFSLLEPVPVHAVVPEYRTQEYGGVQITTLPTPGHTTGSVTYVLERACARIAFTGDLVYAPGKVWSLAATQWSYTETEGAAMTVLSCWTLAREHLSLLLPSHGEPMDDPPHALALLATRMQAYVDSRRPLPWDLRTRLDEPYLRLTEHLLLNTSSTSCSYALLSRSGAALLVDYGYDMTTGLPSGHDRASRRPWLASLPALRRTYGVGAVEVALATHYHDDHVAGLNLLREAEGTEVWVPASVAPILQDPSAHDLPCLWFDPVAVDRVLQPGTTVRWHEYDITVHDLPGHTLYAAAFEVEVDGLRVLFTGDQQDGQGIPGQRREFLNYQYRNRFRAEDYRRSAALYRQIAPGVMVSGHWEPRWVDDEYLEMLAAQGEEVVERHRELLPVDVAGPGADGILARIEPYRSRVPVGGTVRLTATVHNPRQDAQQLTVRMALPAGWASEPTDVTVTLPPAGSVALPFELTVGDRPRRRVPVAVDVRIGELHLGQHAEALVDVVGS